MPRLTSKLQVTIPGALARRYGLAPGDEVDCVAAADAIRVVPRGKRRPAMFEIVDHALS